MVSTTRTIKVASENCQKLARLGTLENSFNSLIERLFGIYYVREKKTTTATGNRREGTGEPNNTDMNSVAEGKRFMDDSKTVSDDVIISYLDVILTAAWSVADIMFQRYAKNEYRQARTKKKEQRYQQQKKKQQELIDWRRGQVIQLISKGKNLTQTAEILKVDIITICRDTNT